MDEAKDIIYNTSSLFTIYTFFTIYTYLYIFRETYHIHDDDDWKTNTIYYGG